MNKERLLNVAKSLRESPQPNVFAMHTYHRCGTPACAVGHYAARRDLQSFMQIAPESETGKLRFGVWGATRLATGMNAYDSALTTHFGINSLEVDELFGADGCADARTANDAAEYIELWVADRG